MVIEVHQHIGTYYYTTDGHVRLYLNDLTNSVFGKFYNWTKIRFDKLAT